MHLLQFHASPGNHLAEGFHNVLRPLRSSSTSSVTVNVSLYSFTTFPLLNDEERTPDPSADSDPDTEDTKRASFSADPRNLWLPEPDGSGHWKEVIVL